MPRQAKSPSLGQDLLMLGGVYLTLDKAGDIPNNVQTRILKFTETKQDDIGKSVYIYKATLDDGQEVRWASGRKLYDPDEADLDAEFEQAVAEAMKLGIPSVGVVDTNCDPDEVTYPIPGNDDAIRSITLFTTIIADAVLDAKARSLKVAPCREPSWVRQQRMKKGTPHLGLQR